MIYIDFTYLGRKKTMQGVKGEILKFPVFVANTRFQYEMAESAHFNDATIESLDEYCSHIQGRDYITEFKHPNTLEIVFDASHLTLQDILDLVQANGLIVKVITQKQVTSRFGIFNF